MQTTQTFNVLFAGSIDNMRKVVGNLTRGLVFFNLVNETYLVYPLTRYNPATGNKVIINLVCIRHDCVFCFDRLMSDIYVLDGILVYGASFQHRYLDYLVGKDAPVTHLLEKSTKDIQNETFDSLLMELCKYQIDKSPKVEINDGPTTTSTSPEQVVLDATTKVAKLPEQVIPDIITKAVEIPKQIVPDVTNILLVASNSIDALFLKHVGKGKFEYENGFNLEKGGVYQLALWSKTGVKVNIKVIHRFYSNARELINDVDGIIVIPRDEPDNYYDDEIAFVKQATKRLVGSCTPTFIFKDFESLWDKEDKKKYFLEPFSYIISELLGITIV